MVLDPLRTDPLDKAIHKVVKKGDVVCDIGAGLGLLSLFALSAGARFVYAIDCDGESIETAIAHAREHGVIGKISFIEGHSSDVYLPEKANVVICETIGSAAFDENILATLADAKRRFLKQGGKIIPAAIELWAAPATFKIPSPLRGEGQGEGVIETSHILKKDLLSEPKLLARIKTGGKFSSIIHVKQYFTIKKPGTLSGMAIWPKVDWAKGIETDASPLKPLTHWKQCVLPDKSRSVSAGDKIKFELIIRPDSTNPKEKSEILWKFFPTKILTNPRRLQYIITR